MSTDGSGAPALPHRGPGPTPPGLLLALANGYKWQRTSNLIAKGNDAVSIRLDSPQKAISSNNKKKNTALGVKIAGIDRGFQY